MRASSAPEESLANLADRRSRRGTTNPAPALVDTTTILVIAVPGTVDPDRLRAAVESHLLDAPARTNTVAVLPQPELAPAVLVTDGLRMDLDEMRVSLSGREIELAHQEFLLLKAFMQTPRRVLTRKQLLELAWDYDEWGVGRTVDVHVRRLRLKLGAAAPQIVTVRGFGYRFEPQGGRSSG